MLQPEKYVSITSFANPKLSHNNKYGFKLIVVVSKCFSDNNGFLLQHNQTVKSVTSVDVALAVANI